MFDFPHLRGRTWRVHPPQSGDPPFPTLIVFHAMFMNSASMAALTNFDSLSDREGFFLLYPDGLDATWHTAKNDTVDDAAFIHDLLDFYAPLINFRRVYATGFSAGGCMCHLLACSLPGTIQAFVDVAGAAERWLPLPHVTPMGIRLLHGDRDLIIPANGSPRFRSVHESLAFWYQAQPTAQIIPNADHFLWTPQTAQTVWDFCKPFSSLLTTTAPQPR